MNAKIRTIIISLIAAGSFATATVAPTVSQAADGTCDANQAGDVVVHENKTTINGRTIVTEKWTEVCGKDGKWHKSINFSPPPKSPIVKEGAAPVKGVVTSTPPLAEKTTPVTVVAALG